MVQDLTVTVPYDCTTLRSITMATSSEGVHGDCVLGDRQVVARQKLHVTFSVSRYLATLTLWS